MKLCNILLLGCMLWCTVTFSQNDSINRLEEVVVVTDSYLQSSVIGQKKISVLKKDLKRNISNATETLRFNTPVAIRDYGNGGTSSPRFRGTSASNTAVLWNGININALGNGQTDLNSLSIAISDELIVKSGGGSVKYGSGAIGGSIHLNDVLKFKDHQSFNVFTSYGSFNTLSKLMTANVGGKKWALKVSSTYNKSSNDFDLIDPRYIGLKNENGAYHNYGLNFNLGYKFSSKSKVSFYTTGYKGERQLSGELPNPSTANDKYKDFNQRNLLVWNINRDNFSHVLKTAFLTQEYRYFSDQSVKNYDFGKFKTLLLNYDLNYKVTNKSKLNFFLDLQNNQGKTNKVKNKKREQYSVAIGYQPFLLEGLKSNIEVKKEFNSLFKVPTVFAFGNEYSFGKQHLLLFNVSSNYRVPTLNDLYWPGQGNAALVPETSNQWELGYQLSVKNIELKTTFFSIDVNNKIVWVGPNSSANRLNVWTPLNIDKTKHRGLEVYGKWKGYLHKVLFSFTQNYIYTIAKNVNTQKSLIFVPKHLSTSVAEIVYKQYKVYVQNIFQSKVYTTDDNVDELGTVLNGFAVFNLGMSKNFIFLNNNHLTVGASVKNIFNQLYQYSNQRPMPGRSINLNINYKF